MTPVAVLFIMSICCAVYFAVLLAYAGPAVSILWLWPCLSAGFAVMGALYRRFFLHSASVRMRIMPLAALATVFAAFLSVEAVIGFAAVRAAAEEQARTAEAVDYCIVFGAKVRGSEPSNSLRARLEKACRFAEQNPGTVFVLSGGKGRGEDKSEALAMYDYMTARGIAPERLLLENRSKNTRENMENSLRVIRECEERRLAAAAVPGHKPADPGTGPVLRQTGAPGSAPAPVSSAAAEGGAAAESAVAAETAAQETEVRTSSLHIALLSSNYHIFRTQALAHQALSQMVRAEAEEADHMLESAVEAEADGRDDEDMGVFPGTNPGHPVTAALRDAVWIGVPSGDDPVMMLHMWIREGIAVLYEKYMGRI